MTASAERFFSPRAERAVLEYVLKDFPFPLTLTYSRLQEELDRQEPVAAAWQLRDAYECLLKFSACLAVADCLNSRPPPEVAENLVGLLLKPTGLSVGDWHSLLVDALKPLEEFVVDGALSGSGRVLPELLGVFFDVEPSGLLEANDLNREIDGKPDSPDGTPNSFVRWRNKRFGHGVFRVERAVYVRETLRWLDALHRFYEVLRPVLDARQLVSVRPGGEELVWRGTQPLLSPPAHEHEPSGDLVPMFLAPRPGEAGASLPLSPFLSVQPCEWCGQPTAFFFDKYELAKNKKSHKTFCLEYFGGHLYPRRDWQQVGKLSDLLPEKFKPKRGSYDQREVAEGVELLFRDFAKEYVRPDYLFDAFWRALGEKQRGYIHLTGEGGTGKTYFVGGLEADGAQKPGTPVLTYHVLPGARTDYRTFISELADRARERLNFRTQEPQTNVDSHAKLQDQLVEFLGELMRANRCNKLVVALDAIDELPDPGPNSAAITDFLPPPEKLPRGCFVLLTSRRRVRPKIDEDLERIRGDGLLYISITLSPEDPENRHVVAVYVTRYFERLIQQDQLPEVYRSAEYVGAVLERSGGIFLYARHLAGALASGAFTDPSALPEAHEFYPAYLVRLRSRVGRELYDTVYVRTLLLLSAAQEPVTLEHLHRWGAPPEGLRLALYDLADFLRQHRGRSWHESLSDIGGNRYELAHEAFVRYVQETLSAQYSEAHAQIAQAALADRLGRWADADPIEETDLYDLRHTLTHLHEGGDSQAEEALLGDEGYASACFSAGALAYDRARYPIADDLSDRAMRAYRHLVEDLKREELTNGLAAALASRGIMLSDQGKLEEAVEDYSEAIGIRRHLVEDLKREDLANDLASTLTNKALQLESAQQWQEAIDCYQDAIHWLEFCIRAGMSHLASRLLETIRYRMLVLLELKRWDEAAADVKRLLENAEPFLQEDVGRKRVGDELRALLGVLRKLAPEDRERVYARLDECAELVRSWVEEQ
jgi:tetratricopeptide (TPR) repeat protein